MAGRGTLFGAGRGHPMYWAGCGGRGGCDKGAQGPGAPPRFEKRTTFHPCAIYHFFPFWATAAGWHTAHLGPSGGYTPHVCPKEWIPPNNKGGRGSRCLDLGAQLRPQASVAILSTPGALPDRAAGIGPSKFDVFDWRSRHKNAFPVPRHATTNLLAESVARGTSSVLCGRQNPLHADRRCTPEG